MYCLHLQYLRCSHYRFVDYLIFLRLYEVLSAKSRQMSTNVYGVTLQKMFVFRVIGIWEKGKQL
jgi:hypothetical protein